MATVLRVNDSSPRVPEGLDPLALNHWLWWQLLCAEADGNAFQRLAEKGLATSVFCMPLLPGINDGESVLRPLFAGARAAEAFDVVAQPLFLRPAARARFFPWLHDEFAPLMSLYERLYRRRDYLRAADRERILSTFRRLRLEAGFPRAQPGRT